MALKTELALQEFPVHALLPKRETQVESFLRKYPEYNGDNVLIAIFDTGVDPGAPGLKVTPSGKRKIVDLIDCTGCGDVDTSTIATKADDGSIVGKTGRKLMIPSSWTNPTGQYRVGMKSAYSLFPSSLRKRVQKEKKEEEWDTVQKVKLAEAVAKLTEFNTKCPTPSTEVEKLEYENLSACVESLNTFEKNYKDKGPLYDCVLFHDGDMWRACVDTTEEGKLEDCKLLGPYKLTGEYARIGKRDMINYSISVYDNGDILSIVTCSGSHGTHVASIAGGYHEEEPALNGLAPGAQIISMQIGDNRLGSMETGTGMIRAMKYAIDNKVDLINMSYGESAKWSDKGRIFDVIHKMVTEHNIIFISSAGNDGPALSTTGAPCAISRDVIGVGAYVSPDMMVAEYSLLDKMGGTQYTWSSCGPCADGKLGVCISAPGGAITSVPNWTLSHGQLMNGTSMASPNACGSVGVLLSALKHLGIEYSPESIRRCIENTALKVEGVSNFVQGQGLVQVDKAFEFMKETGSDIFQKYLSFKVSYGKDSGVYIRESSALQAPGKHTISVEPVFHKKTDNALKISFEMKVCLVSTVSWVTCPTHLEMNNGVRRFPILLKYDSLKPGCHYGEVQGFDLAHPDFGPIFRVPISVIIPQSFEKDTINLGQLSYHAGARKRWFFSVPNGITWAVLSLESLEKECRNMQYAIHAVQLLLESAYSEHKFEKYVTLNSKSKKAELVFKVEGGYTLELCIARWWMVNGDSELSASLTFHGLDMDHRHISLNGAQTFERVDVSSYRESEEMCPAASLTHHVMPLSPKESSLKPLGARDLLPDGEQIYSLELTYNFHLGSTCEITAMVPSLVDLLYESYFESQLWMLYDSNKSLCGVGDVFPMRFKYFYNLDKGDYVLKLQVRHSDYQVLERTKDITVNIYMVLASPIALDVHYSRANLVVGNEKNKIHSKNLISSSSCPVYFTLPGDDKFPKTSKPGEFFIGKATLANKDAAKKVCKYPLTVTLPPAKISTEVKNKDEGKKIEDEYEEAHEEFLATWITKLDGSTLQSQLVEGSEDNLLFMNALLNSLDTSKNRMENLEKIICTAKKIISKIDQKDILSYIAMKVDPDEQSSKKKKEVEKLKGFLINALSKMALAVADGILSKRKTNEGENADGVDADAPFLIEDVDSCYRDLQKFVEATDAKMLMVIVRHGMVHHQYGRAIKAMMKYFEGNGATKALYEVYILLAQSSQWNHVEKYLRDYYLFKFPPSYELF